MAPVVLLHDHRLDAVLQQEAEGVPKRLSVEHLLGDVPGRGLPLFGRFDSREPVPGEAVVRVVSVAPSRAGASAVAVETHSNSTVAPVSVPYRFGTRETVRGSVSRSNRWRVTTDRTVAADISVRRPTHDH